MGRDEGPCKTIALHSTFIGKETKEEIRGKKERKEAVFSLFFHSTSVLLHAAFNTT